MESLGFSTSKITSSVNRGSFTSFPIWFPFISLSCLIALDSTSSTMLNRSDESEHSCLVPDLIGKAFSFAPLSMMFTVGFSHMTFIMLR